MADIRFTYNQQCCQLMNDGPPFPNPVREGLPTNWTQSGLRLPLD